MKPLMLGTLSRVPAARLLQLGECRSPDAADGQSQTVVCSGSAQAGRADERNAERGGEARQGLATSTSNEPRLTVVGTGKPGHLW